MSGILKLLEDAKTDYQSFRVVDGLIHKDTKPCRNGRCICQVEQEIEHLFVQTDAENDVWRCYWCETQAE